MHFELAETVHDARLAARRASLSLQAKRRLDPWDLPSDYQAARDRLTLASTAPGLARPVSPSTWPRFRDLPVGTHLTDVPIENLTKAGPGLYRGGWLLGEGPADLEHADVEALAREMAPRMAGLKDQGIKTIVSLMNPDLPREKHVVHAERLAAERLGLRWVDIPLPFDAPPSPQMLRQYLDVAGAATPDDAVFVHCKHGRDRTGTMVSAGEMVASGGRFGYRQALQQMASYGFSASKYPNLAHFLRDLSAVLRHPGDPLTQARDGHRAGLARVLGQPVAGRPLDRAAGS